MVSTAYILFVAGFSVAGGLLGIAAHFWRAHAIMYPEDLGFGEPLNTLSRDDYQWEKHVVGAEWDDAGYWDPGSVPNLLYYMISGFGAPLVAGLVLWTEREPLVGLVCDGLLKIGLQSPLCP
jgi:hypothetical protein